MVDSDSSIGAIESWGKFLARGVRCPDGVARGARSRVRPADPGGAVLLVRLHGQAQGNSERASRRRDPAVAHAAQQGLGDGVRSWTANGFFWSGNFAMVLGGTLAAGGSLVLQRTFQPEEALDLMDAERVNFLFAWPHQWAQLEAAAELG